MLEILSFLRNNTCNTVEQYPAPHLPPHLIRGVLHHHTYVRLVRAVLSR